MLEVEAAVSGVGVLRKVLTSFAGAAAKDVVIEAGASRVFWSGEGAMDAAMNYAKANGGTTLEMTRAGQNLQKLIQTRNIP